MDTFTSIVIGIVVIYFFHLLVNAVELLRAIHSLLTGIHKRLYP